MKINQAQGVFPGNLYGGNQTWKPERGVPFPPLCVSIEMCSPNPKCNILTTLPETPVGPLAGFKAQVASFGRRAYVFPSPVASSYHESR